MLLKKILVMAVGLSLLTSSINLTVYAQEKTGSEKSEFETLLTEYNITVRGTGAEINAKELKGVMKTSTPSANLRNINMNADMMVHLSAKELLEVQYYNFEGEMREKFFFEARNTVIDVEFIQAESSWAIGSSYTPYAETDIVQPRKTTNISSKKSGSMTIKDNTTGVASSVSATLTGKFFLITEDNQWVVGADGADYSPSYGSPVMLANENVYVAQQNVSGIGGYVGNEVSCWYEPTFINGSRVGTIDLKVYPASKYNTVKYSLN